MTIFWVRHIVAQLLDATRFLSRLPAPSLAATPPPLAVTLRAAPLAGLPIAAGPALSLVLLAHAGLPSLAVATLAIAGLVLVTGALHEDGLADSADGFGGGRTPDRKLEIMRDSRIGTFGATALGTSLLLRVAALQALLEHRGATSAALALVAAAVLSRALMLVPLTLLVPARAKGLAHAVSLDGPPAFLPAFALGVPLAGFLARAAIPDGLIILAGLLLSASAVLIVSRLARHHIGGVTGDVIGAAQQAAEVTFLLTLCSAAFPG